MYIWYTIFMIGAISTALSGLMAASKKVETSAENIANLNTSGALDANSGPAPYQTQITTQTSNPGGGVSAQSVPKDPGFVTAYDPNSPFANADGLIGVPNTDLAEEAVNLKTAEIAYKANLKTLETADELNKELLSMFDKKV